MVIHGQSEQRLKDAQQAIRDAGIPAERILAVRGPIQEEETQRSIIERTVEHFGRIDALVRLACTSQNRLRFNPSLRSTTQA